MKLSPPKTGLALLVAFVFLLSCKKADLTMDLGEHAPVSVQNLQKIERMSKFLSVTLNVSKESVVYNPELKEFSVLNSLKFDYASVETRYDAANEYKLNHE